MLKVISGHPSAMKIFVEKNYLRGTKKKFATKQTSPSSYGKCYCMRDIAMYPKAYEKSWKIRAF